jgi:hypothetical protein
MAQMTFEALVDWLAEESANGDHHDFDDLPTPTDGAPNASDFFSMLTDALGDLAVYGIDIDRYFSQWVCIRAFGLYYVKSYEYDVYDSLRNMDEVHEFIDSTEEDAEEESQNIKDTYNDLNRWLDSGG